MSTEAGAITTGAPRHDALPSSEQAGRVARFNRTERSVHWTQAITFLTLLLSGFILTLPWLAAMVGHRALFREIHLSAAFFFFFGPAIIALSADRRSVARDVAEVDRWDRDDLRWLIPFPLRRLVDAPTPDQGRFNAGQKLNAIFVAWSTLTFTVSGLLMWQNRRFPTDVVERANSIHTWLAYLGLAAFLGHLYLATVHPKTRHSFRAMTQGWVRADWANHHHSKWLQQLAPSPSAPAYDSLRTALQILLGAAAALFAVRVLFFYLGANVTDKVTMRLYDLTAWPGAASIHPQTGVRIVDWPGIAYCLLCVIAWLVVDQMRRLPATETE